MSPVVPARVPSHGGSDLLSRLRSCWNLSGADDATAQRLLFLQFRSVALNAWLGDVVLIAGCLLLGVIDPDPPAWMPAWIAAMVACSGFSVWRRRVWMRRGVAGQAFSLAALQASTGLLAVVFSIGLGTLYAQRPDPVRVMIAGVAMGALCGGTLRYHRLPQFGLIWIGVLEVMMVGALAAAGRPQDLIMIPALLGYGAVLASAMLNNSRQFIASCQAEFEAERQREMMRLLLRDVEGASGDWFWECDTRGRPTHVSARLAEVLGCPGGEMPDGRTLPALLVQAGADREAADRLARQLGGEPRPFRDLVVPMGGGGARPRWWSLSAKPLLDVNGRVTGWRGVGVDVSAARAHEQALHRLVGIDALTGLANRHAFHERLRAHLGDGAGGAPALALFALDLDRFKAVNDAHGHAVGDRLLQEVGRRLQPLCAAHECLARLGGDEYALVAPGGAGPHELAARGQRLLQALRAPFEIDHLRLEVRASLGIAAAPLHARTPEELQRAADIALYAAKAGGRDRPCLYDHEVGSQARTRAIVLHDLARAVSRQELRLDYQLVVDAEHARPLGAEALLRWQHPEHGELSPLSFIPLAEEGGQIVPIGAWVLRRACEDAAGWPVPIPVSVNLSAVQLRSRGLADEVAEVLARTGLPPQRLEIELTESALADDDPASAETLARLRALGVRLALDDFGTGYSSLASLQRFGFDRLKIDRAFVESLRAEGSAGERARALVGAIVGLARALGLTCTAEGVEHPAQAGVLSRLGCTALQGHLFSRPVPLPRLMEQLGAAPG